MAAAVHLVTGPPHACIGHLHKQHSYSRLAQSRRCRSHSAATRLRQSFSCRSQIGFNLSGTPRKAVDRLASELLVAAASLLLLQPALQGKVAQAFLKLLQNLRAGRPEGVLESYGVFYRELLSAGYSSWQDCLLDEVLAGRGSQIAKQVAAQARLPSGSAVSCALACDLDTLQKLSVAESTLVSWVQEVVPSGLPSAWPQSAADMHPAQRSPFDDTSEPARTSRPEPSSPIQAPPTPEQKQEWREQIGGQWQWSAGLPALEAFWARHGCGLIAAHSTLRYSEGGLEALPYTAHVHRPAWAPPAGQPPDASGRSGDEQQLLAKILEHGMHSRRTQLYGTGPDLPSYVANWPWLMWDALYEGLASSGVRLVRLPLDEIANVLRLQASLSQHPRTRFLVVLEMVARVNTDSLDKYLHLRSTGWPDNVGFVAHVCSVKNTDAQCSEQHEVLLMS